MNCESLPLAPELNLVVVNHIHDPRSISLWEEDDAVAGVEASLPKLVTGPNRFQVQARNNGILDELLQCVLTLRLTC